MSSFSSIKPQIHPQLSTSLQSTTLKSTRLNSITLKSTKLKNTILKMLKKNHRIKAAAVVALIPMLFLNACATTNSHSLVYQNSNNQYQVTGIGRSELAAKNNAISAANNTCGRNKVVQVLQEQNRFNGVLKDVVDEKTGRMIHAATGILSVFTGQNTDLTREDDYQTELSFVCKNSV